MLAATTFEHDELIRWDQLHQELLSMARSGAARDYQEGRLLLLAWRIRIHARFGIGSFHEYAERFLGHRPKMTQERLRVAEALERLPLLAAALREGKVLWSVVRELTRVATAQTEQAWLDAANAQRVRDVERRVSGRIPGDLPDDAPRPEVERRRLVLELRASTFALLQEARKKLVEEMGESLDDDTVQALLCQRLLEGPHDDGRAPHQIAYTVCAECRTTVQHAGGEPIRIEPEALEAARCDAQEIGRVDGTAPERASQTIPPAIRRLVIARHHRCCAVRGCRNTIVDIHHIKARAEGGTHDPELLVPLCRGGHHSRAHEGTLVVTGSWSSGFLFHHADGSPYGAPDADARKSAILSTVQSCLRGLGFKESEARAGVDRVRPHVGAMSSSEEALRLALSSMPIPRAK